MSAEQFDKHIFNLSQQAADDSAMPFNEEAWQRMEQLLDGDKKKRRFALWWWLLPMLLLGSGTAIYIYHNTSNVALVSNNLEAKIEEPKTNNQTAKAENKVVQEVRLNNSNTPIAKKSDTSKIVVKEIILKVAKNNFDNTIINASETIKSVAKTNTTYSYKSNKKQGFQNHLPEDYDKTIKQNINLNLQQLASTNNTLVVQNTISNNINNAVAKVETKLAEIVNTADKNEANKNADTTAKLTVLTKEDSPKKKPSFPSKFEISAFAAADVSAVDLSLKDPKSLTFGIGLSYQITAKLSIATGFSVSKKLYSADSADYKNQPWAAANYKLKTVDANCVVYEVPINLQYQFAKSKKTTWVAIGGVSTYFMKSEQYDYNYTWYNQPRKTTYTIENKNNHLLSILNVAIGYRRQLGKQLSYQLAPFLKIPLTGIGEGKVNLYSAGLQLSVNLKGK